MGGTGEGEDVVEEAFESPVGMTGEATLPAMVAVMMAMAMAMWVLRADERLLVLLGSGIKDLLVARLRNTEQFLPLRLDAEGRKTITFSASDVRAGSESWTGKGWLAERRGERE